MNNTLRAVMMAGAVTGLVGTVCPANASLIIGNTLGDRQYATDFPNTPEPVNVLIVNANVLPTGHLSDFMSYDMTTTGGSPTSSAGHEFYGLVLQPVSGNMYQVVYETALLTVPTVGTSTIVSYAASFNTQAGDLFGFFGSGIPVSITSSGTDGFYYPTQTAAPALGDTITLGSNNFPDYGQSRDYAFAAKITPVPEASTYIAGALLLLPFAAQSVRKLRARSISA